jgi:hypothetical protein
MNQVEVLQKEASSNPLIHAVCLLFAARERARNQVTVLSLKAQMKKEGWQITDAQAREVLEFFAKMNVGKLKYDSKQRVTALVDIKIKLQSLGKAAISKDENLESFRPSIRYSELPMQRSVAVLPVPLKQTAVTSTVPVSISVAIEGKNVMFPITLNLTADKLGTLLVELHQKLSNLEG